VNARNATPVTHTAPVLCAVLLAAFSMPLSFTGPAVATPAIGAALAGSPIELKWITNAFMLAFGSTLMAAGAIADRAGRRRVFLLGVAGFSLASLALSFAPNLLMLDVLRALQGIAGSAAFAGGAAALAQVFEGQARTRAFSLLGTTFGAGLAFGPLLSGYLIDVLGWRSVFLTVTVITICAFVMGSRYMQESRDPDAKGLDGYGVTTFTAALTFFTYALLLAPETGWSSVPVVSLLIASTITLVAFVNIELRLERPMLDLSLFRYPRFVGVQFLAAAPAYSYVVLQVLLPIRFIGIDGFTALEAGRLMIALSAPMLVLPFVAGMLTRWLSPGTISGVGLTVCAIGLVLLAQFTPGQPVSVAIVPMLIIGIGISLPWGLMDGLAVSVIPKERAGMATGIFSTTRVAGEGIALAVVAAILSTLVASNLVALRELPGVDRLPAATFARAGDHLATGNMEHAAALLPMVDREMIIGQYGHAFTSLLYILAGITLVTAAIVFAFLNQRTPSEASNEQGLRVVKSPTT
jgi:EmrB/QacA subfamily drug resistance transporter